ncbi:MAG: hypothetical protein JWP89_2932 [Schlesneria sp.]|nr:hypothetical protein [Schlesneria sp.]
MKSEAKSPSQWAKETRSNFERLVCEGDQINSNGLTERIDNAAILACHHDGDTLVGVAALKNPADSYRLKVSRLSGFDLSSNLFPFELGWVYVVPEKRGRGLARQLVAACLNAEKPAGVYATTREDNVSMQSCLHKNGFRRAGQPYKSKQGDHYLVLYVREEPMAQLSMPTASDGVSGLESS